ncbi:MAG: copper chaperone PCu(A)C [Gemmatimonadota bacterium]|nr:copper chaperone PCu(A)C [Gemmatimonadota bacterium]
MVNGPAAVAGRSMGLLVIACSLVAGACTPEGEGTPPTVTVSDAFALDPLGTDRLGLYATLVNHASTPDTLAAVASPVARDASLHEMTREEGLMRMRPLDAIELPPGSPVHLAPGSLHGMLETLVRRPVAGDSIEVTFELAKASDVTLTVPVRHPADARGP